MTAVLLILGVWLLLSLACTVGFALGYRLGWLRGYDESAYGHQVGL